MTTVVVIFGIAYLLIAMGRIPPVLIAVLGAIVMVALGVINEHQALSYVNLEVILLLAAMMSLAEMAGRTDVFEWAAIRSAQLAGGSGFRTLCLMATFAAVASAFLDVARGSWTGRKRRRPGAPSTRSIPWSSVTRSRLPAS